MEAFLYDNIKNARYYCKKGYSCAYQYQYTVASKEVVMKETMEVFLTKNGWLERRERERE